jgi:DNA polymerase (family 10)
LGEVEAAGAQSLPRLVAEDDLRGALHCHTDFSDGGNTLAEMAEATRKRGPAIFRGRGPLEEGRATRAGLSVEKVWSSIGSPTRSTPATAQTSASSRGIESDILEDGSLDYPDEVLGSFDFVVASVHSRFPPRPGDADEAHSEGSRQPSHHDPRPHDGRLLLRREGYELDIEQVLQACAHHG